MSEEIQKPPGTEASSDDTAQVVGPTGTGVAAEPAAEVSPGVGPGPGWVSQERLSKQQSAFQRLLNKSEEDRKRLEQELQELKGRVRTAEMQGMTEAEQQAYAAKEQQDEFQRWQEEQQRERYELAQDKYETEWLKWYVANGIPLDVLNNAMEEAESFEQVQATIVKWALQQQAGAAATPGPTKPPVTPTDKVQGGSVGAPPSMKFDEIFGGKQVDLREAEKYVREVRKAGRLH